MQLGRLEGHKEASDALSSMMGELALTMKRYRDVLNEVEEVAEGALSAPSAEKSEAAFKLIAELARDA